MNTVYRSVQIPEFEGNPLIEALPPMLSQKELVRELFQRPKYMENIQECSDTVRLMSTQQILRFHQPLPCDFTLATSIDKCIRWGYADRNPLSPDYVTMIYERYEAGLEGRMPYRRSFQKTYGFSVLGVSGVGKSTTVEVILKRYPQFIQHIQYNDRELKMNQVVWMKVDCPCDGSPVALCKSIFDEFDHLLGTNYMDKYKRCSLDDLLGRVTDAAARENLGILVIDEIQHLITAKTGTPIKVLNYLVSLVNHFQPPHSAQSPCRRSAHHTFSMRRFSGNSGRFRSRRCRCLRWPVFFPRDDCSRACIRSARSR